MGRCRRDIRLLLTIFWCSAKTPSATPYAVTLYITSVYWFAASTSFANPAVTIARSLSDTFAGIRSPGALPLSIAAQLNFFPEVRRAGRRVALEQGPPWALVAARDVKCAQRSSNNSALRTGSQIGLVAGFRNRMGAERPERKPRAARDTLSSAVQRERKQSSPTKGDAGLRNRSHLSPTFDTAFVTDAVPRLRARGGRASARREPGRRQSLERRRGSLRRQTREFFQDAAAGRCR